MQPYPAVKASFTGTGFRNEPFARFDGHIINTPEGDYFIGRTKAPWKLGYDSVAVDLKINTNTKGRYITVTISGKRRRFFLES